MTPTEPTERPESEEQPDDGGERIEREGDREPENDDAHSSEVNEPGPDPNP